MKTIASIQLDRPDRARGFILLEPSEVYSSEVSADHDSAPEPWYSVVVSTPDGNESGLLPDFETEAEAREAIAATWGRGPWDLQWQPGPKGSDPVSCACCGWQGDRAHLTVNAFHLAACPGCYSSQIREGGGRG